MAAIKFITSLDLSKNELLNSAFQQLSGNPANAVAGQFYYNTTDGYLMVYDGVTGWKQVGASVDVSNKVDKILGIEAGSSSIGDIATITATAGGGIADSGVKISDLLGGAITGASNPTSTTDAVSLGRIYLNTTTATAWLCTARTSSTNNTWVQLILTADLSAQLANYQPKITVSGVLQGNGSGTITERPIDATPTSGSTNLVTSGGISLALSGKQNSIEVEGILEGDGLGGISAATIDVVPEISSSNLITSGAVASALSDKQDTISVTASRALVSDASGNVASSSVTATQLGYVSEVTSSIQTQINAKAPTASPALTGTPTAPTASVGNNSTQIATTAFVHSEIASYGALIYMGVIDGGSTGSYGALSPAADTGGWLYEVATAGMIDGKSVSIGDMFISNKTTAAATSENYATIADNWDVIEVNVGSIYGPDSSTDNAIPVFDGTSGKLLKNSTVTISGGVVTATGFVGAVTGNASTATALQTACTIGLSGVTATAQSFDGSANITIPVTQVPASLITDVVPVNKGGIGVSTLTSGQVLIGNGTGAVTSKAIDATPVSGSTNLITSGAVASAMIHKYTASNPSLTQVGSSGICTWTIDSSSHGISSAYIQVSLIELSTGSIVFTDISIDPVSYTITINIIADSIAADTYGVVAIG